jgi:hypothetical protein
MASHAARFPAAAKDVDHFPAALSRLRTPTPVQAPAVAPPTASPALRAREDDVVQDEEREAFAADFAELLGDAAELVIAVQHASPQMLQRKLRVGREDSLRLLEALERKGIVGPADDDGEGRPVLMNAADGAEAAARLRDSGDPVAAALRTEDPDPAVTAGAGDRVREPTDAEAESLVTEDDDREPMTPAAARGLVYDWLRHRQESRRPSFTASDSELTAVRNRSGNGRAWIYKVLKDLTARGVLRADKSGSSTTFTITDLSPLDRDDLGHAA